MLTGLIPGVNNPILCPTYSSPRTAVSEAEPGSVRWPTKKNERYLHMASLAGIQRDEGLKAYFDRKVNEGKNKMSLLNAVKNKLLARVFPVVSRGTSYQKINHQNNLFLS